MTAYPHIAERLFGQAHAIEPHALRAILEGPAARRVLSGEKLEGSTGKKNKVTTSRLSAIVDCERVIVAGGVGEFGLTDDGIAIVPICGVLSRRFDWLTALCGWTTYEGLSAILDAIAADSRVIAALLDVESPGGEAAGMLDVGDKIIAFREHKQIWAVANTVMCSAAYAVGGSASRVVLPRLAQIGSLGAVRVHVDQSASDLAGGEKYTAIYSGARKIDGWGHAPLSEGAAKVYQANVDNCRNQLCDLVGRQGRMTSKQALATEAAVVPDFEAVSSKYADDVLTFEDALAELTDYATKRSHSTSAAASAVQPGGQQPMKTPPNAAAAAAETNKTTDPAPAAAASADKPAPTAPAQAEAPSDDGDKCPTCNGSGKKTKAEAPAAAPATAAAPIETYTTAMGEETLELCTLAGAPLATARGFVAAKTPIAKVRADLAAAKAAAADGPQLNLTPAPTSATAGWDEAIANVNKQLGHASKK
jgi:ClpP class serine protease